MKKLFLPLFLCCVFISRLAFANNDGNNPKFKENLTVCSESGFIPFEMKDSSGHWDGFDIDIIKKFALENKLNLVMLDISLDGLIPALSTKKCDLIASGLTITEERANVVLFSQPVYSIVVTAAFIDSADIRNKFKQFNDIDKPGIKIASQTGSAATNFLKKTISHATLLQFSSENDEVNALLQKKADVFVEDNVFITQVEKKFNKKFYVLASTEKGDLAFAARKDEPELISKLNLFITKIKQNGEYSVIKDKYF